MEDRNSETIHEHEKGRQHIDLELEKMKSM